MRRARMVGMGLALVVGAAGPAAAQIILDAPGFTEKKPAARLPDVKPAPLAWPRLDPGAVLCRSEADLDRLAARRLGEDSGTTDCRRIATPTAVTIMVRKGPGRTQVRFTDAPTVSGWTDVWLPDRAPSGAGRPPGR